MAHEFTLTDRNGDEHHYVVMAHPASEGERVVFALAELAPEPLLALIGSFEGGLDDMLVRLQKIQESDTDGDGDDTDDDDTDDDASDFNLDAFGPALTKALRRMDGPALRQMVLSHTKRDGKLLSQRGVYDKAFSRNYAEMFKAAFEVCRYNGFFPEFGTTLGTG